MSSSERKSVECTIVDRWYENPLDCLAGLTKLSGGIPGVIFKNGCNNSEQCADYSVLSAEYIDKITPIDGGLELVDLNHSRKYNTSSVVDIYSRDKIFLDSIKTCFEKYMAETISQNFSGC